MVAALYVAPKGVYYGLPEVVIPTCEPTTLP